MSGFYQTINDYPNDIATIRGTRQLCYIIHSDWRPFPHRNLWVLELILWFHHNLRANHTLAAIHGDSHHHVRPPIHLLKILILLVRTRMYRVSRLLSFVHYQLWKITKPTDPHWFSTHRMLSSFVSNCLCNYCYLSKMILDKYIMSMKVNEVNDDQDTWKSW